MSRLRNILETCPIYDEAKDTHEYLMSEVYQHIDEDDCDDIKWHADWLLRYVDQCRDIASQLRDMCVERGEEIQRLEEEIENRP